jgi:hypothetical protein
VFPPIRVDKKKVDKQNQLPRLGTTTDINQKISTSVFPPIRVDKKKGQKNG